MDSDADANLNNPCRLQENGTYSCRGEIPYPKCWNDEKRMDVLYAPFRERDVNPENYDSKLKFWEDMFELYCTCTGSAVFCKAELQIAFTRGNKLPYSLDTVIDDLYRKKKIRLFTEYEYDPLNGWKSWAINGLVWRPLSWGVNKLKTTIGKYSEDQTEYVHLAVLKKFCEQLQTEILSNETGKLMHYNEFKKITDVVHVHLKEKTLNLCLHTLNCQKRLALEYIDDGQKRIIHLIKIPAPNDPNSNVISEMDHATHRLQMTQSNLLEQLENLENEILILDKKVRQLVNDNKRSLAKTYLKKKHLLEKNHEKRALALQNIEELMSGVEEAHSHGQILNAYKIGSNALQQVLNSTGLKFDKVDEVVADVREALDSNREIEVALANAGATGQMLSNSEEHEIDLELKDIINEERVLKAPDVPQYQPGSLSPETLKQQISSGTPFTVTIKDADLLAMLEQLELENSPERNATNNNNRQIAS